MYLHEPISKQNKLRENITQNFCNDEAASVNALLENINFLMALEEKIRHVAFQLVTDVRREEASKKGMELFMAHYDLSTHEGIMLMCLAEALLRIPDKDTENLLIRDKLTSAHWQEHLGKAESRFVNLITRGLVLTEKVLKKDESANDFTQCWHTLVRRSSEPVVRMAVREAIKVMSEQFVLGRTIEEALKRSEVDIKLGYCFSYDMLGEAARTLLDADNYQKAYLAAMDAIAKTIDRSMPLVKRPSISVKLSALYPRYDFLHQESAVDFLSARLKELCLKARDFGMGLTVDAEESDRLDMSLDIIEKIFCDSELKEWDGLGLAVQAYQKRAMPVLRWLADLASRQKKQISVRLVKGAYWDSEIKRAQQAGYPSYPVFTRKIATDVSYLACAKFMLTEGREFIYPQFATHNAYTVAAILTMLEQVDSSFPYEFQSLHGMGNALHAQLIKRGILCRVYAPVGTYQDLLPYLVRRLLENGANSSFVNQIANKTIPIESLTESPVKKLKELPVKYNAKIPLPADLFGELRKNSKGFMFVDYDELRALQAAAQTLWEKKYIATPQGRALEKQDVKLPVLNPANHADIVGYTVNATSEEMDHAKACSVKAFAAWDKLGIDARAAILVKMADLLEQHRFELMILTAREAGKVLTDLIAEVREAVDFCRYYAEMAKITLAPKELMGYTGETNTLRMKGRGTFLCISPWNFPIAIFTGQVAACLVAGNCVLAKPAEQTTLVAARVVELFHEAGVPKEVLQLLPALGQETGEYLVTDERVSGVLFTGSTATAKSIQAGLAQRKGAIVPLIAETGGINAMIADSTALPEQLVDDVITSAFGSAGQRCSALRVLFIQEDIADKTIRMLKGAMETLWVGEPVDLRTDVGPVIDADAKKMVDDHIVAMKENAVLIAASGLSPDIKAGTFVAPHAFELKNLAQLNAEIFGPVLHVIRYQKKELDTVLDEINALGYGLTFGIQSRINETVEYIQSRMHMGNIYVNRTIIGAMVGVQPFGGSGLSGTGPKAGGPHYLLRLCEESTLTINTTAAGGNATLMALG